MIKNIKSIMYFPCLFLFLPAFAFYFPLLKKTYLFFYLILYFFIILTLLLNRKNTINRFIKICKLTPLRYYMLVLLFMSANGIILSLLGFVHIYQCLRSILMQIILLVLPIVFYFSVGVTQGFNFRKFVNVFFLLFWINLIIGFIAYIGQLFDITTINNFFEIFSNIRVINTMNIGLYNAQTSNYVSFGIPRLDNLFEEPGHYAQFLFLFLPLIYSFCNSKIRISNNKIINILIKKTLVPFTWISIVLTLSPIFLIFSIILTLIYYSKYICKFIVKNFDKVTYVFFIFILFMFVYISNFGVSLNNTYLSRIVNVITNITSFENFMVVESSLASRVCCYINSFCIFIKHPFFGVGIGNLGNVILDQYNHSPVPLTSEIIALTNLSVNNGVNPPILRGFIYSFLAENGIFIFSILVFFFYKVFINLNYIINTYKNINRNSFSYVMALGIKGMIIALIINSFYNLNFVLVYFQFIIAISSEFIYNEKYLSMDKMVLNKNDVNNL